MVSTAQKCVLHVFARHRSLSSMTFPEQLKAQRERLGLTQAELASFLDVSPRAVWQWEKGTLPHVLTQEGVMARLNK